MSGVPLTAEFAWRLWHRARWGHPYYSHAPGPFNRRLPCARCQGAKP